MELVGVAAPRVSYTKNLSVQENPAQFLEKGFYSRPNVLNRRGQIKERTAVSDWDYWDMPLTCSWCGKQWTRRYLHEETSEWPCSECNDYHCPDCDAPLMERYINTSDCSRQQ